MRKKFKFETKFNNSDDDVVWFLWGVYSLLYKEDYVDNAYSLFNYEYKISVLIEIVFKEIYFKSSCFYNN